MSYHCHNRSKTSAHQSLKMACSQLADRECEWSKSYCHPSSVKELRAIVIHQVSKNRPLTTHICLPTTLFQHHGNQSTCQHLTCNQSTFLIRVVWYAVSLSRTFDKIHWVSNDLLMASNYTLVLCPGYMCFPRTEWEDKTQDEATFDVYSCALVLHRSNHLVSSGREKKDDDFGFAM